MGFYPHVFYELMLFFSLLVYFLFSCNTWFYSFSCFAWIARRSFLGQVIEAKLKFWAYAWMVHLANSLVGGAPGIKV
jgi:hypothetical protein